MTRATLTISVLTKNDAHQINRCLTSAAFADELVVIDNGSTDDTASIASSMGAVVYVYPQWRGFAVQRNLQLKHARSDYVLLIDSDEVITPALRQEVEKLLQTGTDELYDIPVREIAFGTELKHMLAHRCSNRFFKRELIEAYEGLVHEQPICRQHMPRRIFKHPVQHFSRVGIHQSLRKLTQYTMLGAAKRKNASSAGVMRGLASGFFSFIKHYVFRLGFTGGGAGFLYCLFISMESFFRYAALEYDRHDLRDDVSR
jgi:glycosyltransferase involved in cell wall biosynthesis